jgi:DNA invertase Pin-like site-specific DNA recombinase
MDVVILTRISKDSQSCERQIDDLKNFVFKKGYNIVGEFNEKISGAAKNEDRAALNSLNSLLETKKIKRF